MTHGSTVFAFKAVASNGSIDNGTVDATSIGEARAMVLARGALVLSIEARGARRERREPLSAADAALGLRILADLLESGLSVSRALAAFESLAPRGWKPALPHLEQSVREGKSLAAAMSDAPVEIPALVIGIAHAGEAGGGIGPAIRRGADLTEATADMQSAIRGALAYPAVVGVAGVLAVTVLLTVVLPRFARILADLGQKLPASTQLVLHIAAFGRVAVVPGIAVGVVAISAWRAWTQTDRGRTQWHALLLRVPFIGGVRRSVATARMAHSLSALLESGVPIASALTFSAQAAGDSELQRRLIAARRGVLGGQSLSAALSDLQAATPTAVNLVRAGEESGQLSGMLSHAAKIEQKRADQIVRAGIRLLEPMLLLCFASVVALVAAALLQAIYSVRPGA